MGVGRRLIQKRHKLRDDVQDNVPKYRRVNKRDDILNDSPEAYATMRGTHRRQDKDFDLDMFVRKQELAWEADADIERVDFDLTPGVAATGSLQAVAQASLVDGETFTLDDGVNPAVVFEFDVLGNGVGGGNVAVNVSADVTPDNVRATMQTAVNGAASLDITASDGGAGLLNLVNDTAGAAGNVVITETVANAGFIATGMAGGVDAGVDFGLRATFTSSIQGLERGYQAGDELRVIEEGSALESQRFEGVEEANSGDVTAAKARVVSDTVLRLPDDASWSDELGVRVRVELGSGARL